jgi:hypothetical protein
MNFRNSIFILFISLYSKDCLSQDLKYVPSNQAILRKYRGKALMRQMSRCLPFKTKKFFDVSEQEKEQMEAKMKIIYNLTETLCDPSRLNKITDLSLYFYQYMGVIKKGKRYIYINAFPPEIAIDMLKYGGEDWRIFPAVVGDGGPRNWGVFFNLQTNEFEFLAFNGRY